MVTEMLALRVEPWSAATNTVLAWFLNNHCIPYVFRRVPFDEYLSKSVCSR
jgi:hypothetical protein